MNQSSQNKLTTFLAFALIAAFVTIAVLAASTRHMLHLHGEDQGSLKRERKATEAVRDSLQKAEARLITRDRYWTDVLREERANFAEQLKRVKKTEIRYEKAYTTPPPAWDRDQLDSLLEVVLTRRHNQH